jgi:hypothetical protein
LKTLIRFYYIIRSWFLPVYSVVAYDFNNADPTFIGGFEGEDGWNEFFEVKNSLLTNGRDGVYFFIFKQGRRDGWLTVLDSDAREREYMYWNEESFVDSYRAAWNDAKQFSKNLGFREREDSLD